MENRLLHPLRLTLTYLIILAGCSSSPPPSLADEDGDGGQDSRDPSTSGAAGADVDSDRGDAGARSASEPDPSAGNGNAGAGPDSALAGLGGSAGEAGGTTEGSSGSSEPAAGSGGEAGGTTDGKGGDTQDGSGGSTAGSAGSTDGSGGDGGSTGGNSGSTGGNATGGGGNGCLPGLVVTSEGSCVLPGTVDDFGSCDSSIYDLEQRNGHWYFYRGLDVGCELAVCQGTSSPPWASRCGAWSAGGYDPYYLPTYPDLYAGIGLTLNDASVFYDACDYTQVEVEYASDQAVQLFAKWNDIDVYGDRYDVLLPATSGTVSTRVPLTSFVGLDCSKMTELEFEPTSLVGFGIAVYSVRFVNADSADCADGASRCNGSGDLELCVEGRWAASSCDAGQQCVGGRCIGQDATPVEVHGHLRVSGTQLVNESGAPVQLKGISSQWLNYETDGYATSAAAMAWMRDNWGITLLRAAMGADADHEGSYMYDAAGRADMLAQVETIIQNAIDAGLYVLVDWHSHQTYTAEASDFFATIAASYGSYPNILIETYNEPLDVSWTGELKPYHAAVVGAFRAADPNDETYPNVAILGTPNWDQDVDVAAASPLEGVNLMYTAHFYSCSHGSLYLSKAQAALNAGLPLFVTEWGATHANGGEYPETSLCTAEADSWHAWMDANGVGWAAWKLDDCDGQTYPDVSCLLANNAPLVGGWTSEYLNGHASYVISKL